MSRLRRPLAAGLAVLALLQGCSRENPAQYISSAKEYLAADKRGAAIVQLKNALAQDPANGEGRFLLGRTLLESGDAVLAAIELQKAADLGYAPSLAAPTLARAWMQQGQHRKVIEKFASTTLDDPNATAELKGLVALAYGADGNNQGAASSLDAAARIAPEHPVPTLLRARRLAATGDLDRALALVGTVTEKHPKHVEALLLKADLLVAKKEQAAAIEAYRAVLAARREELPAHFAFVSLLLDASDLNAAGEAIKELKKIKPGHPSTQYLEARLAFQQGRTGEANEIVQSLLKRAPDDPEVLLLSGNVAFQMGALRQAEQQLAGVLQKQPNNHPARELLAWTHLRNGEPAKTLAVLKPVLERQDSSEKAISLAAAAHSELGDLQAAERLYRRLVELNPKSANAKTALARNGARRGDAKALSQLESLAASDAGVGADMALITARIQRRELDAALQAIDRLQRKRPSESQPSYLRGRVQLLKGDPAGARKSFDQAAAIDPLYFPAIANLAALDAREGKLEHAEQRFTAILKKNPNHVQTLVTIAALRAIANKGPDDVVPLLTKAIAQDPANVAARLALVNYHLGSKQGAKAALDAAQSAVSVVPDNGDLLDALGRAQIANGDLNQAIASYNRLAALQPGSARPHVGLADVQLAAKDDDAAARSLKKALAIESSSSLAMTKLVALELRAGRAEAAMAIARSAQAQRATSAFGSELEGDVHAAQRNWTAASAAYQRALQKEGNARVARRLYAVLRAAEKRGDAEAAASSWLKAHPLDVDYMLDVGAVALRNNDPAAAEQHFARAVQLQPGNPAANNNLAWALGDLKKPGALEHAEKANALQPNQPAFMDTLARQLAAQNKLSSAIELQTRAVALDSGNPAFRLALARFHAQAGNKAEARKQLEPLLVLGDKYSGHAEVRRLQQEL
jgi:cellulose synthase operon protein C